MKKNIVYVVLRLLTLGLIALISHPVHAEWALLAKDKREDVYYVDSAVTRAGKIAKAWVLIDFSKPMIDVQSVKRLYEANCTTGRIRIAYKMFYLEKGGVGAVRSTDAKPGFWNYPAPESISEQLFDKLCGEESGQEEKSAKSEVTEKPSH